MKKMLGLLIIIVSAFVGACASAQGVPTDTVTVQFIVEKKGIVSAEEARIYLCDKNGVLLGAQNALLDGDNAELTFTVPEYLTGEKFYLIPMHGTSAVISYQTEYKKYSPVELGTFADLDEDGNTVIGNIFHLTLIPEYIGIDAAPDSEYSRYAEGVINSSGIDSKTNYFIWISKKDFSVNVFKGKRGEWDFITCFPCSIGKPSTPTITGVFEYFQYQDIWRYEKYYCAPIMRFAPKGYAMHSVLVKYDGSFYDGRLGKKISEGCVRMAPENIRWLADNMPLKTRVYITE